MRFKRSVGLTASERVLAELCDVSFLKLWTYPNLFKKRAKELTDLLVVFGQDVIIFSDKSWTSPPPPETPRSIGPAGTGGRLPQPPIQHTRSTKRSGGFARIRRKSTSTPNAPTGFPSSCPRRRDAHPSCLRGRGIP